MLAFAIATGMSQGVLPLIGYNYSSKNFKRMMSAVKTTFIYSLTLALISTLFLLTCAGPIVRAFIDDPLTIEYGSLFQRIICVTCPCVSVSMIIITLFPSSREKGTAADFVSSAQRHFRYSCYAADEPLDRRKWHCMGNAYCRLYLYVYCYWFVYTILERTKTRIKGSSPINLILGIASPDNVLRIPTIIQQNEPIN